jgi:hypothetical protein
VELAGVFARQAAVAIRATRVERDTAALLRAVAGRLAGDTAPAEGVDQVVAAAVSDLGEGDSLWPLVEQITAIRRASPEQLELVTELLAVLARRSARDRGRRSAVSGRGLSRRSTASSDAE